MGLLGVAVGVVGLAMALIVTAGHALGLALSHDQTVAVFVLGIVLLVAGIGLGVFAIVDPMNKGGGGGGDKGNGGKPKPPPGGGGHRVKVKGDDNVVSVGSPGQTAKNIYNIGTQPMVLSAPQADRLIAAAKEHEGTMISVKGDGSAQRFTKQLADALGEAGWIVGFFPVFFEGTLGGPAIPAVPAGVELRTPAASLPPPLAAIASVLESQGFAVHPTVGRSGTRHGEAEAFVRGQ